MPWQTKVGNWQIGGFCKRMGQAVAFSIFTKPPLLHDSKTQRGLVCSNGSPTRDITFTFIFIAGLYYVFSNNWTQSKDRQEKGQT